MSRRGEAGEPPYLGTAAFGPADRGRFFGREDVLDLLRRRLADRHLVVVCGPSGSGKTSLLRAGLGPSAVFREAAELRAEFAAGHGAPDAEVLVATGSKTSWRPATRASSARCWRR